MFPAEHIHVHAQTFVTFGGAPPNVVKSDCENAVSTSATGTPWALGGLEQRVERVDREVVDATPALEEPPLWPPRRPNREGELHRARRLRHTVAHRDRRHDRQTARLA